MNWAIIIRFNGLLFSIKVKLVEAVDKGDKERAVELIRRMNIISQYRAAKCGNFQHVTVTHDLVVANIEALRRSVTNRAGRTHQ